VLKVGVFGTNGVLNIGGGTLSADTELKLYASGSNGQLNFISNVTLGGNSAKILAANSITIFNGVVVTIGGTDPADVFTNHANYSESSGGNDSTTGMFAGAEANNPQPLSEAPPFDPVRPAAPTNTHQPASGRPPRRAAHGSDQPRPRVRPSRPTTRTTSPAVVDVRDSDELLSLIHSSTEGTDAQPRGSHTSRNTAGADANGRNTASRTNAVRNNAQLRNNIPSSTSRLP
jgi:hypothetical protein